MDLFNLILLSIVGLFVYAISIFGGRIVISSFLEFLTNSRSLQIDFDKNNQLGRYIGMFERLLVITFVFLGDFTAIGLIFAGKSIARFKDLDNRDFAEYYLIGTLFSITIGLISGLVLSVFKNYIPL